MQPQQFLVRASREHSSGFKRAFVTVSAFPLASDHLEVPGREESYLVPGREQLWDRLGASWDLLWANLGLSWATRGHLGSILGPRASKIAPAGFSCALAPAFLAILDPIVGPKLGYFL